MECNLCQALNNDAAKFCRKCGAPTFEKPTRVEESSPPLEKVGPTSADLTLLTWKPLRWLFVREYGSLTLTNDHLKYDIFVQYTYKAVRIFFLIASLGFNNLALIQGIGRAQLKNVTVTEIKRIQWFKWSGRFLFIRAANFIALYPYSAEQAKEVSDFAEMLTLASVNAKYKTAN
jgi:hypothetical protein